ncbi:hypothetical protein LTR96_010892 [Exophiala xenobiotica]|nr:hypothetical protein LTR92_010914 [Exophiala xenobiotica]KAK5215834.1 hypothetical protein LTR72_011135 [Exophiala xenobiotica]KAK5222350.1 hypothetical protein LTR47_010664 [Exophiala xenobiotica]KAK5246911.1 hypothetical protein LTS06_007830 [Exophiala xenobiotica]KAK5261273.1 hypothetical protein LTR40_002514 [Exophiala xenobiotica]
MDWERQKSKDLVENDPTFITTIKELQAYIIILKERGNIGRMAHTLYKDGDPDSVDFTISSLLFGSMKESVEVKGFY